MHALSVSFLARNEGKKCIISDRDQFQAKEKVLVIQYFLEHVFDETSMRNNICYEVNSFSPVLSSPPSSLRKA